MHIHYRRRMVIRYFLDFVAFVKFLLGFELRNAGAVISAHREFLIKRKQFKQKRSENDRLTTVKEIPTVYKESIVFDFFLKGKKYFHQLNFKK